MDNIENKSDGISQNETQKVFDETYSIKYCNRINIFKKLLFVNSGICFIAILLYKLNIYNNLSFYLNYIFFSMALFHVIGIIHGVMYRNDLKKTKNGESIYLKNYYPNIWKKINPYGNLIFNFEYLKYELGKYIPKNTDPVIDRIRKDKRKTLVYGLPFILMIIFMIGGLIF
jgi:hypothetical protein